MAGSRKKLGEILIEAGVLTVDQLNTALAEQRRWGGPLGRILVEMRAVSEEILLQALSRQLNLPAVNLDGRTIEHAVRDLVTADFAEHNLVIPFQVQGKFLDVAMADPTKADVVDELRIRTQLNVRPYLAGPPAIDRALSRLYGRGSAIDVGEVRPSPRAPSGLTPVFGEPIPVPTAAQRRAQSFELGEAAPNRDLAALQTRVQQLEALVARDEDVIRKLLALLIDKGVATREEILARLR